MFDWLVRHTNELIAEAASQDRVRRGSPVMILQKTFPE